MNIILKLKDINLKQTVNSVCNNIQSSAKNAIQNIFKSTLQSVFSYIGKQFTLSSILGLGSIIKKSGRIIEDNKNKVFNEKVKSSFINKKIPEDLL